MSDPVSSAKSARESLSRALAALQSDPSVPASLLAVADPVSQAMSALFQIERSAGATLVTSGPAALDAVRRALALLQQQPTSHPAVQTALEAVAGSLSMVHGLGAARPAGPPGYAPAAQPAAAPPPAPAAAPPRPQGAYPPAAAAGAAPSAPYAPGSYPQQPAYAPARPSPGQPQPGYQPAAYQPTAYQPTPYQPAGGGGAPQPAPAAAPAPGRAAPAAFAPTQQAFVPASGVGPGSPYSPPAAASPYAPAPAPSPAAPAVAPANPAPAPPPAAPGRAVPGAPSNVVRVEAELGVHSASNFYKGLAGNDIVEHGGLFVATYNIPEIGTPVALRVSLPGGYEFEALGLVKWTRETVDSSPGRDGAQPGFGAQFTQISPEARQLVYRYVRNREPLFHDDL